MPKDCIHFAATALLSCAWLAACSWPRDPSVASEAAIGAYAQALERYSAGDMVGAAARAERSLGRSGRFLPALLLLGKASLLSGDDEKAVAALKRALAATPRAGEAAVWLARAYRASGLAAEASALCAIAVSADPGSVTALRLMASLASDDERLADAKAYLDRALEASAEVGMAFIDRASIRWASGDRTGALADLDAAVTVLPVGSNAQKAAVSLGQRIREPTP
ncbi:MAG TPA: tetratricopeptide repeat protein [Spirochaetales bacterium]|nr:tetratricopeptide repeat protein [Spirochaetales bacterium]HPM71471.1 tetratricopeptide repeat protein [Spirochaetales bacterium]